MFDDETGDTWPGKQIELYNDPDVDFAGKIIGGIRIRPPVTASAPAPAETDFSDDIPY